MIINAELFGGNRGVVYSQNNSQPSPINSQLILYLCTALWKSINQF